MISDRIIRNIAILGERYRKEHLGKQDVKELQQNWWKALTFFFDHAFYRGRRDQLSYEYCSFTKETLKEYFKIDKLGLEESYRRMKNMKHLFDKEVILEFKSKNRQDKKIVNSLSEELRENFQKEISSKNDLINRLITEKEIELKRNHKKYIKNVCINNDEDLMMVLDTLKFISSDNRKKNIYNFLKDTIANYGPKKAYEELIQLRAVSDKIATFTIRDIGLLNPGLITYDYEFAFPIDTWVRQIAKKLRCQEKESDSQIKKFLINKCKRAPAQIDPLKFAAGLWYLGFHAINLAWEYLDTVDLCF